LAFSLAIRGCTQAMMVDVPDTADNITAYALGEGGKVRSAVLINRSESAVRISVARLALGRRPSAMRMLASSATSTADLTFAGARVDADGRWTPTEAERVDGDAVPVPAMSAVVVHRY
jgi:hypothetical protein